MKVSDCCGAEVVWKVPPNIDKLSIEYAQINWARCVRCGEPCIPIEKEDEDGSGF